MSVLDNETSHQRDRRQMLQVRLQRLRTSRTFKYLLHTTAWPSLGEAANHLGGEFDEGGQHVFKGESPILSSIPQPGVFSALSWTGAKYVPVCWCNSLTVCFMLFYWNAMQDGVPIKQQRVFLLKKNWNRKETSFSNYLWTSTTKKNTLFITSNKKKNISKQSRRKNLCSFEKKTSGRALTNGCSSPPGSHAQHDSRSTAPRLVSPCQAAHPFFIVFIVACVFLMPALVARHCFDALDRLNPLWAAAPGTSPQRIYKTWGRGERRDPGVSDRHKEPFGWSERELQVSWCERSWSWMEAGDRLWPLRGTLWFVFSYKCS